MDENDWLLYERYQQGDIAAFNELFERYKNRILNLAWRFVRDRHAAEDIAQEVLLKVYEKKVRFDPKAKFSTWVFRVAANASIDHIRKKKFTEPFAGERAAPPAGSAEKSETAAIVERAIEELPESLRFPIRLFQFEDRSYQEIAAILQISVKAVERRIHRAKQVLREKLAKLIE